MSDNDSPVMFAGLEETNLGFVADDGSRIKAESSGMPNQDPSQSYYPPSSTAWNFQGTPPYDSYDPSSTAPAAQSAYVAPAWDIPTFQQPEVDRLAAANVDPATLFAPPLGPSSSGFAPANLSPSAISQSRAPTILTPAAREQLRNIAMPPHLQYNSPKSASSPDSATGDGKAGPLQSPDAVDSSSSKTNSRKRKVSADPDDEEEEDEDGKPIKKTAHNMIEKRYRTNLNDKIAALRDSVPSLRIMSKSARGEDTTEDREELHGLTPAHKLNKATVLSKATEYIRHLEKRNNRLLEENGAMQARIAAFEKLFMAGAMNGSINPMQQQSPMAFPHQDAQQQFLNSPTGTPQDGTASPAGLIQVPEDMKRIISAQMAVGQPYPVPQQPFRGATPAIIRQQQLQQQQLQQGRWGNTAPYFGKLMVGSLAGLMILEALQEDEVSSDKPEGRGLFALPLQLLGHLSSGLDFHFMGYHVHTSLKLVLLLGTFLWIFVPSLFATSGPTTKKLQTGPLRPAPSLASSIHVRRQAWLTAVQTVWVPRHNFVLEAAALMLKTMKLSLRNAVGVHGYQVLTGLTEEQETARVKAWSIALDSQLAGGDVEINKSRLILTLLASGTLPDTPARLMQKALHIRVLLWNLHESLHLGSVNIIAAKLARARWNEARKLNQLLAQLHQDGTPHEDELPEHLALLVQQDCDDVLNGEVVQRAHNLAFNMDTTHDVDVATDGMDSVVADTAIGSPMDAVAAWWSTQTLHNVLTSTLEKDEEALKLRAEGLEMAIKTAPIGSVAQVRAIVARAVLVDKSRGANIAMALQAMGLDRIQSVTSKSTAIIDASCHGGNTDLRLALRCAMAIAHLRRLTSTAGTPHQGLRLIYSIAIPPTAPMSLLGCTSAMELMEQLFQHKTAAETFESCLERLAGSLRLWMGGPSGEKCGHTTTDYEAQHTTERGHDMSARLGQVPDEEVARDSEPLYQVEARADNLLSLLGLSVDSIGLGVDKPKSVDHPFIKYSLSRLPEHIEDGHFLQHFAHVVTYFKARSTTKPSGTAGTAGSADETGPAGKIDVADAENVTGLANTTDQEEASKSNDAAKNVTQATEPTVGSYIDNLPDSHILELYIKESGSTASASASATVSATASADTKRERAIEGYFLILGLWTLLPESFVSLGKRYSHLPKPPTPTPAESQLPCLGLTVHRLIKDSHIFPTNKDIISHGDLDLASAFQSDAKDASLKFQPEDLTRIDPCGLNLHALRTLANIDIEWTDNVSRHLLVTKRGQRRYVEVFALPSAMHESARNLLHEASGMPVNMMVEIERSYQLLLTERLPGFQKRVFGELKAQSERKYGHHGLPSIAFDSYLEILARKKDVHR
ncbi:Sterol regulatory element-binding protein [Paramyrothecium foliicola]|nr:Sterol regulatory element-binding protein [Paramyrothecium foliicola]